MSRFWGAWVLAMLTVGCHRSVQVGGTERPPEGWFHSERPWIGPEISLPVRERPFVVSQPQVATLSNGEHLVTFLHWQRPALMRLLPNGEVGRVMALSDQPSFQPPFFEAGGAITLPQCADNGECVGLQWRGADSNEGADAAFRWHGALFPTQTGNLYATPDQLCSFQGSLANCAPLGFDAPVADFECSADLTRCYVATGTYQDWSLMQGVLTNPESLQYTWAPLGPMDVTCTTVSLQISDQTGYVVCGGRGLSARQFSAADGAWTGTWRQASDPGSWFNQMSVSMRETDLWVAIPGYQRSLVYHLRTSTNDFDPDPISYPGGQGSLSQRDGSREGPVSVSLVTADENAVRVFDVTTQQMMWGPRPITGHADFVRALETDGQRAWVLTNSLLVSVDTDSMTPNVVAQEALSATETEGPFYRGLYSMGDRIMLDELRRPDRDSPLVELRLMQAEAGQLTERYLSIGQRQNEHWLRSLNSPSGSQLISVERHDTDSWRVRRLDQMLQVAEERILVTGGELRPSFFDATTWTFEHRVGEATRFVQIRLGEGSNLDVSNLDQNWWGQGESPSCFDARLDQGAQCLGNAGHLISGATFSCWIEPSRPGENCRPSGFHNFATDGRASLVLEPRAEFGEPTRTLVRFLNNQTGLDEFHPMVIDWAPRWYGGGDMYAVHIRDGLFFVAYERGGQSSLNWAPVGRFVYFPRPTL